MKAANRDDKAAEANDELNHYNVAITRLVQEYFEQDKVSKYTGSIFIYLMLV